MSELKIHSSNETLVAWTNKSFIPQTLRQQLAEANVLITPSSGYGTFDGHYFPQGTENVLHFLRARQQDSFHIDICIDDKDYKELTLHSDLVTLPDIIVLYIGAPMLAGLLVEYIKYKLGSRINKTSIKANITLTDETAERSVTLSYEGNANDFDKIAGETLRLIDNPQSLDYLKDTTDIEYEERIRRLTEVRKSKE
jgi:hypothetical protein